MKPRRSSLHIPDHQIDDLRRRLAATRLPAGLGDAGHWRHGADLGYLAGLVEDWQAFDWRSHEDQINEYEHYEVDIDGQQIHYLLRPRPGAPALLLLGGWPGTFWDFARVLPLLDDYDVVVADLPGFGLSVPLRAAGSGFVDSAEIVHTLMTEVLGHRRYAVHGGDWGSIVGEQIAHVHPHAVLGLHLTMPFPLEGAPAAHELWAPEEMSRLALLENWAQAGNAYFQMHLTRPHTVAYLGDSPAAMAAWIVEKLHDWTDHDGDFETAYPRENVLSMLSLTWFADTLGTSARMYADSFRQPWKPVFEIGPVVNVPSAIAAYPKESTPQPRKWAEGYFDLRHYTVMERGGHFPAVEDPVGLAGDIKDFLSGLDL